MFDNALIALIISTLIAGEETAGISGTPIKQAFQPTLQGVNSEPTAYLHKLGDRAIGYPKWEDTWNADTELMDHVETQQYETTFQISALSTQDPNNTAQYTASDILNLIRSIIQSQASVATFEAQNVGILRVTEIRNPYFLDDRQQNEASPSFDFTMTHKQIITSSLQPVTPISVALYPV